MIHDLVGKLLIATPSIQEGLFRNSVILLCHHDDEGSMGLIVNRSQHINVFDVLDDMGFCQDSMGRGLAQMKFEDKFVFEGGPVDPYRGFVLHEADEVYDSTMFINDTLHLTASKDVLEKLALGKGPDRFLLVLGYTGWGAGQLEDELIGNHWLISHANNELVFEAPAENRWALAAKDIGFERSQLVGQMGHA